MQVGYIIGNNWKKADTVLKLTITTNSQRIELANIIKQNLELLGIETKINEISNNYYTRNLEKLNYDILLTGNIVSIKPDVSEYLSFNIEKQQTMEETYNNIYEQFTNKPSFIGLYFNSIIIIHSKDLKGNFFSNWYNPLFDIDTWYKQD